MVNGKIKKILAKVVILYSQVQFSEAKDDVGEGDCSFVNFFINKAFAANCLCC